MSPRKKNEPELNHQREQALKLIEEWIIQEEERTIKLKSDKSLTEVIEQYSPCFRKPAVNRNTIKNKVET
ncbi:hypothetical protein P9578_06800 [Brevibacillus choshinensis]|uniref:hypothetical protein n=1 Tax=Brevibacillus choshinensis TaxID=54911 RepID=UPI002E1FAA4A|nr:hypothetical protein [Brevibacillus choshinensis]